MIKGVEIYFDKDTEMLDGLTVVNLRNLVGKNVFSVDIKGVRKNLKVEIGRAFVDGETLDVWDKQVNKKSITSAA